MSSKGGGGRAQGSFPSFGYTFPSSYKNIPLPQIHVHCSFNTPEFAAWSTFISQVVLPSSLFLLTSSTPLFTDVNPPNVLPLETPDPPHNRPSFTFLTASLKGKMSLICHTAMKRGRPSLRGSKERMRGKSMRLWFCTHTGT